MAGSSKYLLLLLVLFILATLSIPAFAITKGDISRNATAYLLTSDETSTGIVYTPHCLVECHLPIKFFYDGLLAPQNLTIEPSARTNINWTLNRMFGDDVQVIDVRVYNGVLYNVTIHDLSNVNVSYAKPPFNGTSYTIPVGCTDINATHYQCETSVISGSHTEQRSRKEWVSIFNSGYTIEKNSVYYIDFIGYKTPSIKYKATDIIPEIAGFAFPELAWWSSNYSYTRNLNISVGSSGLNVPFAVNFTFNHSELVSAGKSLPNASDIAILYDNSGTWVELDRVNITQANNASKNLSLLFRLQANISANVNNTNYWMYYGFSGKSTPPKNNTNSVVYKFNESETGAYAVYQIEEGTGSTTADRSTTDSITDNLTFQGGAAWDTISDGSVNGIQNLLVSGNGVYGRGAANDDYLDAADSDDLDSYRTTGNLTVVARTYLHNSSSQYGQYIAGQQAGTCNDDWSFGRNSTGNSEANGYNECSGTTSASGSELPLNKWITVGMWWWVAKNMTVYLDGKVDGTNSGTNAASDMNTSLRILHRQGGGAGFSHWTGNVSEIMLLNRSTSEAEMLFWHYRRGKFQAEPTIIIGQEEVPSNCTGTLTTTLLSPTTNLELQRNQTFTLKVNLTCTGGCCGNVTGTADPTSVEFGPALPVSAQPNYAVIIMLLGTLAAVGIAVKLKYKAMV